MGQVLGLRSPALPDKAPVVGLVLPEDLRRVLLASLPTEKPDLEDLGFESCVDHPQNPGHQYLEGYFHAVPGAHDRAVDSIHPRRGHELLRRPAPLPLAAFCEAFRRVNAPLFAALEQELAGSTTAAPLAAILRRQVHFADLSVQIHWGDEVPAEHVAWHIDAPNSFLHMAIGLQGQRALHARRCVAKSRISKNCAVGVSDEREVLWQNEGAAYLGSPCCYPHAVEYPSVDWSGRIVALQCRLLFSVEELLGMIQDTALDIDPRGGTAAIVFRHCAAMARGALKMPGLLDVQEVLKEFGRAEEACQSVVCANLAVVSSP